MQCVLLCLCIACILSIALSLSLASVCVHSSLALLVSSVRWAVCLLPLVFLCSLFSVLLYSCADSVWLVLCLLCAWLFLCGFAVDKSDSSNERGV